MARTHDGVMMVSPRADRELLTAVYRHLAKRDHPDPDTSPEAARRTAELNEAYATLSDRGRRARYDEQLGLRAAVRPAVVAGDSRPERHGSADLDPVSGSPHGETGPPPPVPAPESRPLTFGRYRGWTLNQVCRYDFDYLDWLSRTTMGRTCRRELDELLRRR